MAIFETPVIPDKTTDVIYCFVHFISIAISNCLMVAAIWYINALNFSVIAAFEVPLTLLAQVTLLRSYGTYATGTLQYVGASIVFLVVLIRPLLQIHVLSKDKNRQEMLEE